MATSTLISTPAADAAAERSATLDALSTAAETVACRANAQSFAIFWPVTTTPLIEISSNPSSAESLGLAERGHRDTAHRARRSQLHMGHRRAPVQAYAGPELGVPSLEERVDRPNIALQLIQIDGQGRRIELLDRGSNRLEDRPFHYTSVGCWSRDGTPRSRAHDPLSPKAPVDYHTLLAGVHAAGRPGSSLLSWGNVNGRPM